MDLLDYCQSLNYTPHTTEPKYLYMELVAVDGSTGAPKNGRMTKEERKRLGRKLRALRIERELDQVDVANDPKFEISIGTLQAIEGAWYEVRDTNIEKYARYFGTSVTKLLKADEPKTLTFTDPLLKDLNDEHLDIARSYMRARKRVRAAIELVLHHPDEERLTNIILKLETRSPETLARIDALLTAAADDRIFEIAERVLRRPDFATFIQDTLDQYDKKAATVEAVTHKTGSKPTKKS